MNTVRGHSRQGSATKSKKLIAEPFILNAWSLLQMTMIFFVEAFQTVRFAFKGPQASHGGRASWDDQAHKYSLRAENSTLCFFVIWYNLKKLLNLVDALHTETNFAVNIFAKDNPSGKEKVNCEVFFLTSSIHY